MIMFVFSFVTYTLQAVVFFDEYVNDILYLTVMF